MGWDNASTVANEVENPQKTYPRVMLLTLAAIFLSYVIPVLAVWHLHVQADIWATGKLGQHRHDGCWAVAGRGAGGCGHDQRIRHFQFAGDVLFPSACGHGGRRSSAEIFARKLKNGAPWVAIVILSIAWAASLGLSFDKLIMLDILLYGASLVLEFLALIVLRIREPELARPFRVPGGLPGAIALGVGPTALLVIALVKNRGEQLELWRLGSVSQLGFGLVLMALGVVYYFVAGRPSAEISSEAASEVPKRSEESL